MTTLKLLPPKLDKFSEKDYLFSSLIPQLKQQSKQQVILEEMTPVSLQRHRDCTSNAVCDGFEYVNKDKVDLSRLFLYWNSRYNKNEITGTSIRTALDSLRIYGIPPESVWPYDETKVNVEPDSTAKKIALERRRTTYYRVKTVDEIVRSIDAGWPIVFSIPLDEEFFKNDLSSDHVFDGSRITSSFHAMLIVGYRKVNDGGYQFRIRNSWGKDWCDSGYCWFDSAYLHRSMLDAWAITNYTPVEPLASKRNLEFGVSVAVGLSLGIFLGVTDHLVEGIVCVLGTSSFATWRRWWINVTINDKLPLL